MVREASAGNRRAARSLATRLWSRGAGSKLCKHVLGSIRDWKKSRACCCRRCWREDSSAKYKEFARLSYDGIFRIILVLRPRYGCKVLWSACLFACRYVCLFVCSYMSAGVSAAADRPARCSGSAHAKYSVSHHVVIKPFLLLGLAAEYRSRRWVWSTVVRRPSEVYDTHRQTKLTAPETISRSRDIVGAHQTLNGSCDLTTPLLGIICHPWASPCHRTISTRFENTKGDTTCLKWGGLG